MRRPSFQFYPADWLGNTNLRRCTHAEKGVWVDVMCLMHDSSEYGLLRWPLADVAQAVGCPVECLQSLVAKGVMKGGDSGQECEAFIYTPRSGRRDGEPVTLIPEQLGPLWYSSRMVRDEHLTKTRGGGTRFGSPTRPIGERQSAHPNRHHTFTQNRDQTAGVQDQGQKPAKLALEGQKTSPIHRIGEPKGDGPSTSSSSSKKETAQDAHVSVQQEPKRMRPKSLELTLGDWLAQEKSAGRKFISDYEGVWAFARNAGIHEKWIDLAWIEFKRRHTQDPNHSDKTQKDWRATFLNYVRNGWLHLWEIDRASGQYRLTLAGIQLQREDEAMEVVA